MPRRPTTTPMLAARQFERLIQQNRLPHGLDHRKSVLLSLLYRRPSLTRSDYQAATGISAGTAQRDLGDLAHAGVLLRVGRGPASRYCLHPDLDPTGAYLLPGPIAHRIQNASQSQLDRIESAARSQADLVENTPESELKRIEIALNSLLKRVGID